MAVTSPSAVMSWSPTTFAGRYNSEGTWRLITDDPQDGFEVVEWIARQEWSDGKVGHLRHELPRRHPARPGRDESAPLDDDGAHRFRVKLRRQRDAARRGIRAAILELDLPDWRPNSKAALANPALQQALAESGRRIREHADSLPIRPGTTPLRVVPEYESWLVEAMRSGPESPFWHKKGMSVVDHIGDYADVPVLHITGWYDSWTRQVTMNYEALRKAKKSPQRLVIGPWTHGGQNANTAGEVEFTREAGIDLRAFHVRWYDRWLRGEQNGVDEDPPCSCTSWAPATTAVHPAAGCATAGSGGPSANGRSREPRRRPFTWQGKARLVASPLNQVRPAPPTPSTRDQPVPTVGRQHLIQPGAHDQRRL